MPRPTSGTTIQRPDLGAIAYEYNATASQRGFIGLELMPLFDVPEQSSDYPKIPIEALLKLLPSVERAANGTYQRDDWNFETGTYKCKEFGLEGRVEDTEAKLYRRFFDAEQVAVMRVTDQLLRQQEKRISGALFNTSNIPNTSNVTNEWDKPSSCTPKADVLAGKQAMRAASGLEPNALAMSKKVFENLLICAELKDYLKYTNPHLMSTFEAQKQIVAQYLDVERLLVGNAIYDSTKKGKNFTLADVWNDEYVLLAKVASGSNDLRDPCLGRTFLWTEDSPENLIVEQYREEQTRSNIYRVRHYVDDDAFVFTGAGYLLGNITQP